ncbi:MAG TPA: BtrH N-terminal domain-containing protein [Bacteroidales bacterium]|nr:BtrH N-terminal domain-containing protein [Bacteroidales bacterium]
MSEPSYHIEFLHHQAAHCENGATSNLLRHYDIALSEPMIFGIGSGLFFSYLPFMKLNDIPVISFRPWPGQIFNRVTRRLGLKIQRYKFKDQAGSMAALDRNLQQDIPTGCLVGVYHLTYFPPAYRFHFNAHNIVIIGKENGEYLVSDSIMPTIERLTADDLRRVRFAKGTYPPKGRMYFIKETASSYDLKKAIVKGIQQTCKDMLTIPIPWFGVKGIRYIAKRMRKWPQKIGEKKASLYMGQMVRMLEEIGTGGAGFRFIYAAFLQEAAREMKQPWLNEMSKEMTEVGDRWREFALIAGRIFKNRAGQDESYIAASEVLFDIAEREEKIYRILRQIKLT